CIWPFEMSLTLPPFSSKRILFASRNTILVGDDNPPRTSSAVRLDSLIEGCANAGAGELN
ncbi:MAG: hypothetical protein WBX81_07055, partial [Nitrososphaeraceae archaeon]